MNIAHPYIIKIGSLLMLNVLGAFSILAITILFDKYGTQEQLKFWSYFGTLITIIVSPGLMGNEQLIMRFSKLDSRLLIEHRIIKFLTISLLLTFATTYIISNYFLSYDFSYLILLLPIAGALISVSTTVYRARGESVRGVISQNIWKYMLVFASILSLKKEIHHIELIFILCILGSSLITPLILWKKLGVTTLLTQDKEITKIFFAYMIGTISMLIMTNIDRFIIDWHQSNNLAKVEVDFTDYFLLSTYFFSPLAMIAMSVSYYIGSIGRKGIQVPTPKFLMIASAMFLLIYFPTVNFIISQVKIINLSQNILVYSYILFSVKFIYMLSTSMIIFTSKSRELFQKSIQALIITIVMILILSILPGDLIFSFLVIISFWVIRSYIYLRDTLSHNKFMEYEE